VLRITVSAVCFETGHVMWTGQDKTVRCDTALVAGVLGNWDDADATFLHSVGVHTLGYKVINKCK